MVNTDWIEQTLVRYERPLLRYVIRITNDLDAARDAVQDTFLKLVKADRSMVEDHLAAWLFTVARNRALDICDDHKEAFRLKFQDQLTYREISQIMGKSLGTVSKLITTALCTVRDRLTVGVAQRGEG